MHYYRSLINISPGFILDTYPGAVAAYSLRKLRDGYTGPAVRVRRSSDNSEQDIGFTSAGIIDESALLSFVGSGNGFVTTWYDQSLSGLDQARSISNQQPQIVASGSVYKVNNKHALWFDGTMSMRSISSASLTSLLGEWSSFGVIRPVEFSIQRSQLSYDGVLGSTSIPRIGQFLRTSAPAFSAYDSVAFNTLNASFRDSGPAYNSNQVILNSIRKTNTVESFANKIGNGSTSTTGTANTGITPLDIGYRDGISNASFQPFGYIQELIHYPLDSSSFYQDAVDDINWFYKVY